MKLKRWLGDTLFRRLFILMWVALVGSHVVAYSVVSLLRTELPPHGSEAGGPPLPTFPSLPPTPGFQGGPGEPGDHGGPFSEPPPPHGEDGGHAGPPMGALPTGLLVLDYGVRLLIIGLAAWLGARWLSRPMQTLAAASRALTASLGQEPGISKLDDTEGTTEVRETARVFNDMARRLSEQFRARGLMVAALSHDLRTPLTRMRLRMVSLPDDPLVERCVSDIREMNELIDSALQMFRDSGSTEPFQNTDVCSVVQSLTDDLLEQGQPVTFSGSAAVVRAQPVLLRRVVSNLVSNALRYGQRADVWVQSHAHHVRIVVDDVGPGIPSSQLEAVFQPFYRVESSRNRDTGGTGLGLYIARDLIVRQGGTLTLLNRPEGGLRAEVLLPRGPASR
ncbi:MAG: ATP-binding protein [Aquabacterium sp.]|uniref:ATP-binding protein n=1 Tax=Aquabacterium sp. TaxID=1872578 RepID=UPI00272161E7|nr:ATP-binding protein [Aquabacterium sp.]MDO9005464.1 ATP-binding protein [Aquabacterium sp.]